MDVQAIKQEIEGLISRISDAQKRAELQSRLDGLVKAHAAADAAAKPAIENSLTALRTEAGTAASGPGGGSGGSGGSGRGPGGNTGGTGDGTAFLTTAGYWAMMIITFLTFAFLFFYFWQLKGDFTSPANIRPLLVLTLIVAMLGFGGLMMIRALFAPYDKDEIQERFRLGREVFLVFSGIFGTIIGFYFGSESETGKSLSVDVAYATGRVTAAVTGGAEPFTAIYTPPNSTGGTVMSANGRVYSIAVPGDCPKGAKVEVIDGRGRTTEGKVDCPPAGQGANEAQAPPAPDNGTAENAADNAQDEASENTG